MSHKEERPTQYEAKGFNRASEATHGRVTRAASNIRLSLTLRIALHYCVQLMRTLIPAALIMTIALGVAAGLRVGDALNRAYPAEPDPITGEYSQEVLRDESLSVFASNRTVPDDWKDRISFHFTNFMTHGFPKKVLIIPTDGVKTLKVYVSLRSFGRTWLWLMGGLVLADLARMRYFVRKRKRLDKRVLAPIRDITEMTQTLSAANLSNRINVAGTKNELRDLAIVINEMLDRLEQSYNSQKQFVSDASHELRTPIAVIQGYADMLRRWGKDDPEVLGEGIEAISQETAGMKDLVENLLFLARHDKKTLLLEMASFDAGEMMNEVCREAAMVTPGDRFTLDPAESGTIEGDRGMIKQLMRILVDNAVKYSPAGGEIRLGVRMTDDACEMTVTDQGSGIASKDLPHIFERFYRADEARHSESGGHGLGLSIARIIVVAHGGKIQVKSKPGAGTCFAVILPKTQKKQEEKTA